MTQSDEVARALSEWAPDLAETLSNLAYMAANSEIGWLSGNDAHDRLLQLTSSAGTKTAVEIWRSVLKERVSFTAPGALLVLENLRRHPSESQSALSGLKFLYANTLANVAFRAADVVYENGKSAFSAAEIDVAIARFRAALAEFRFAIESSLLSEPTMRIAMGKYATAVAMIGRWTDLPPSAVTRAIAYSQESMTLGNLTTETLDYRLQLLLQQFDQTGDADLLDEARRLTRMEVELSRGSELAQVEVRLRLALLAANSDSATYLEVATKLLYACRPRNGVEEARRIILVTLIETFSEVAPLLQPRSIAVPRGLLAAMASDPSPTRWTLARRAISGLNQARKTRGVVPCAIVAAQFLRQILDGPPELLTQEDVFLYVELTAWLAERAVANRHLQWEAGSAALSAAKRTGNRDLAVRAEETFEGLATRYPSWPLPRIGIARVRDYLFGGNENKVDGIAASWREAAALALSSPVYGRSNLGGRNEVFAVADARGFLSETFVFKPTTKAKAEHEAAMLGLLKEEITRIGLSNRFEVPRALAIVEVPSPQGDQWVIVTQRAAGRLATELRPDEVPAALDGIVELLIVFHRVAGTAQLGKSAWRSLKDYLKMWSRTLFGPEDAERFVDSLKELYPANLPLVRKRDGHASNWLVDPAGRIVAIDFESTDFVPAGYDVAQLLEDNALVPPTSDGWLQRVGLLQRYFTGLGVNLSETELIRAYAWFALTRALRLGTEREAGRQLRRHARELCSLLVDKGDAEIQICARQLLLALGRIEQTESSEVAPGHDHRRLSKSMAYMLRHNGPANRVPVDGSGFASLDDLGQALKVDSSDLLAIAEHPGEPRFEVRGGLIRALYGHSLDVKIDSDATGGPLPALFHGSSWAMLNTIVRDGLLPMQRQMVHLTNNANEAVAVGRRKGEPIVFEIDDRNDAEPVAAGIWVTKKVAPEFLSVLNPFADEAGSAAGH